jgi:hypothetical protein
MRGFRIIALVFLVGMINVVETAQIGAKYEPEIMMQTPIPKKLFFDFNCDRGSGGVHASIKNLGLFVPVRAHAMPIRL